MAETIPKPSFFPYFHNFTAGTTTTEVELPSKTRTITIGSASAALYVALNGASDGGAVPSDRAFVPSGNYISLKLGRNKEKPRSIFVAGQSGSAAVSIIIEEE